LSPEAEPLPGFGAPDMLRLSAFFGELAQKKGMEEFLRNHPGKYLLFFSIFLIKESFFRV